MTASMSWRSRWPMCRRRASRLRCGWSTGCSGTSWSTSPAIPTAPKSASTSSIRPTAPTGRLGLVEFRALEMPPDPRMSLAQQLLIRALIAKLWREPQARQVRALGHHAARSLHAAAFPLGGFPRRARRAAGSPATIFRRNGTRPSSNSAFPLFGRVHHGGVALELRQALEPWHVLGEEGTAGGTVRYVDSSVERLQVKADGFVEGRHVVTCNGRRLPMTATGRSGEAVAAVRFKAWQPASGLHPTIPVHAPLTFDLIDTWNGRSLGGCVYHVAHPGGRNYDDQAGQFLRGRGAAAGPVSGPRPHPRQDRSAARGTHN